MIFIKMFGKSVICQSLRRCHTKLASEKRLIITESNGIRNLIMNSPKTRNALCFDMMSDLLKSIQSCHEDDLRCIVIRANGPVFSSGHNLKQLAPENKERHYETFALCGKLALEITAAPVPIIAAIDGIAAAAGCQLASACDLVIATKSSKFSTPGASFGLFCSGPGVTISRSIGRKHAAQMLFTGLPVSAEEALHTGLISQVCEDDRLDDAVEATVAAIKSKSRAVIEIGKKFFYHQISMNLEAAYKEGAQVMAENLSMPDGQEGLKSFVGKRKPVWTHSKS